MSEPKRMIDGAALIRWLDERWAEGDLDDVGDERYRRLPTGMFAGMDNEQSPCLTMIEIVRHYVEGRDYTEKEGEL
jgi:hypothetical protein